MDLLSHIQANFNASIETQRATQDALGEQIAAASSTLLQGLLNGQKILTCGNGRSAANAATFATQMVNRFEYERPGLPAIALTMDSLTLSSIANDYAYAEVFAKQVSALGQQGDILMAISTSGQSDNVLRAVEAAHEREMPVIALSGRDGGRLADYLAPSDLELRVPAESTVRIQETHLVMLHCLCDLVDRQLLGIV